jgi:hypothetical protein
LSATRPQRKLNKPDFNTNTTVLRNDSYCNSNLGYNYKKEEPIRQSLKSDVPFSGKP